MILPELTIDIIKSESREFCLSESSHSQPSIYGITDGKAIGTYLEHKFKNYLRDNYVFIEGSSAKGVDFPEIGVDVKVTSVRQPQSSCPFKSARQKIFGLGYAVIVFAYKKTDNDETRTGNLSIEHCIFVDKEQTADYQMTRALRDALENDGNKDDLIGLMLDRNLPVDEIQANEIADEIMQNGIEQGYLTISNALQWRLQYSRVIEKAGSISGVHRLV